MIFLGFIALIPAGFIAVLALSKNTSPAVRRVSIIALIVIGLTFITCTIILVVMFGSSGGELSGYTDLPMEQVQEVKRDFLPILIASIAVLLFLIWVITLAIREQRQKKS
jgi:preprotein translocase subunit SecG